MRLFRNSLFYLSLVLALALGTQIANLAEAAFTEPTVPFPGGAPAAPLDTSGNSQIKSGSLEIDGFLSVGGAPAGHTFDVLGALGVSGLGEFNSIYAEGAESRFSSGTYVDPVPGVAYGIKIGAGGLASNGNIAFLNGKVGIGTTTPARALQIEGAFPQLRVGGSGTASPGIEFYDSGTYRGDISAGASAAFSVRNNASAFVLTILQGGNVGIGTIKPAANLEVVGTVSSTQVVTTQICFPDNTSANCKTSWPASSVTFSGQPRYLALWDSTGTNLTTSTIYQDSNKNLGVGTITPGAKLTVNNPNTAGKVGSAGDAIYAYANSGNAALSAEQGGSGYAIYSSGSRNYFSGSVGIGTNNPQTALHVVGDVKIESLGTTRNALYIGGNITSGQPDIGSITSADPGNSNDTFDGNTHSSYVNSNGTIDLNAVRAVCLSKTLPANPTVYTDWSYGTIFGSNVYIKSTITCYNPEDPFYKIDNQSGKLSFTNKDNNVRMTLDQSGTLSIGGGNFTVNASGNTNVAGTLGVTGATTLSGTLGVTGATTLNGALTGAGATFSGSVAVGSIIPYTGTLILNSNSGSNAIAFQIGGTEKVRIDTAGHIGIGVTDPGNYALNIAGKAVSTLGWEVSSDIRLKTNIESLTGVLDKLQEINAVRFDWRNLPGQSQIGLIAQQVETQFPELVTTDNNGYKALAYDRFTAVLLEAIKEQQAQINSLQNQVTELKAGWK